MERSSARSQSGPAGAAGAAGAAGTASAPFEPAQKGAPEGAQNATEKEGAAGEQKPSSTAAKRWTVALNDWAIPEEILATAPEPPWGFPVQLFLDGARRALAGPPTPTHRRVAADLPVEGVLLDVGSGAGAASLPVAPPGGRLVAVDQDPAMLKALADLAAGAASTTRLTLIAGRWPDVAGEAGVTDVAVAANVAYNVGDLAGFVASLTRAARRRVVLELTAVHPLTQLGPLWEHFWQLRRPDRPLAEDAAEVVREVTGSPPSLERWAGQDWPLTRAGPASAAWARRRLCLPEEREAEVAQLLQERPLSRPEIVTMWWPGTAGAGTKTGQQTYRAKELVLSGRQLAVIGD